MLRDTSYAIFRRLFFVENAIQDYIKQKDYYAITIADIGCGTGELLTIPLSRYLGETGVIFAYEPEDITFKSLKCHIEKLGIQNIQPVQNKGLLQNQLYDVIIISEVIEHVEEPIVFLHNLKSMLKPLGIIIITTPNGFGIFEIETMLFNTLEIIGLISVLRKIKSRLLRTHNSSVTSLNVDTLAISPHINFFTLKDLYFILSEVGLSLKKIEGKHLAAGPFSDRILNKSEHLIKLNSYLGKKLPLALVAGWMLITENKENRSTKMQYSELIKSANLFRKIYSSYKRSLNIHLAQKLISKKSDYHITK